MTLQNIISSIFSQKLISLKLLSIFASFVLPLIFVLSTFGQGADEKLPIQVFIKTTCQHCMDEKAFFDANNIPYETIIINDELEKYSEISKKFTVYGPPLTLAGNTFFEGYSDEEFGQKIIEAYNAAEKQYTFDEALNEDAQTFAVYGKKAAICDEDSIECSVPENQNVNIPFLGSFEIQTQTNWLRYSSAFILGFLDGFNPCAMWVLIIFIITLIQVGDRIKMMFVAGTFLLAEGILYGLILVLWFAFFNTLAVGYEHIINIVVGITAVCAGAFFLYEGIYTDGTCKVTNSEQRKTISQKISDIANSPISWAAFGGILLLALSVNVIEFACSAGYPQIFTNILSGISGDLWHKSGLILTYLGAYMLDDLIVFGIALISIEKLGITQKYAKACNIFGGIIMLILGLTMVYDMGILKAIF